MNKPGPAALLAIAALALGLRFAPNFPAWLWYDEYMALAQAQAAWADLPRINLVYDRHPFGYPALLHLWAAVSSSTGWLLALSALLGAATAVALVRGIVHALPARWAAAAGLLFAVLPAAASWGAHARMYALLMALTAVYWIAARATLRSERNAPVVGMFVAGLALAFTHALAVFAILAAAADAWIGRRGPKGDATPELGATPAAAGDGASRSPEPPPPSRPSRLRLAAWGASVSLPVAVCVAVVAPRFGRSSGHVGSLDSAAAFGSVVRALWAGTGGVPFVAALVALLGSSLVLAALADRAARRRVAVTVLVPFAIIAAAGLFGRPLWHERALVWGLPFCAIWATWGARIIASRRPALGVGLYAALVVASLAQCVLHVRDHKPDGFARVAEHIGAHAAAGDVVYAPRHSDLWAVSLALAPDEGVDPQGILDAFEAGDPFTVALTVADDVPITVATERWDPGLLERSSRAWIVVRGEWDLDLRPLVGRGFHPAGRGGHDGVRFLRFER